MLLKNKNNCTIFNKFLIDDLLPYNLNMVNNNLVLSYNSATSSIDRISASENNNLRGSSPTIPFNEKLLPLIVASAPELVSTETSWFPVFMKDTETLSQYKPINRGFTNPKTRIGIDDFISFTPSFQNWQILSGGPTMSIDWIINNTDNNFDVLYGIICWAKRINISSNFLDLSEFPNGSILVSDNSTLGLNKKFIKLDDDTIFDLSKDSSKFLNTIYSQSPNKWNLITSPNPSIEFNNPNNQQIVKVSSLTTTTKFKIFQDTVSNSGYILWIPDGDFFCHSDKTIDLSGRLLYKPTESYLSPSLYKKYVEIYNVLTLHEKKDLYQGRKLTRSRLLKKVCYALASSPLMDGVNHRFLLDSDIQTTINNFVYNPRYENGFAGTGITVDVEMNSLKNCLVNIFNILQRNNYITSITYNNISTNYICNLKDLFKKLINKYDTNLTIKNNTNIKYKSKLKYGGNIAVNQSIKSWCSKDINNTLVYNNQEISLSNNKGSIRIYTDLSDTATEIKINSNGATTSIPLADIKRVNRVKDVTLDLGKNEIYEYDKLTDKYITISSKVNLETDDPTSYTWELVEGPCAKFSDINKDRTNQARFDYSTDYEDTKLYISSIGRYVIKCTVSTDFGTVSAKKVIFVIDKDGYYLAPNSTYSLRGKQITLADRTNVLFSRNFITLASDKVRCLCSSLEKIAIDQKGIFVPSKTGFYIGKRSNIYDESFTLLEGDEKFQFTANANENNSLNDQTEITLNFKPNNTIIKLNSISLQNIRNGSEECNNCIHIYKDLIVSDNEYFGHRFKFPDTLTLKRYDTNGNITEYVDFEYPQISTRTAGPIKSYGGYNQQVVSNIGISIPEHTNIGGVLPNITGHNLMEKDKICHQLDVNYNGYLNFQKGIFHPSSGWIKNNAPTSMTSSIQNKSSVLKFNPLARRTLVYKGQGFTNMKSSYVGEDNIPNIYSSSITLAIDSRVQNNPAKEGMKPPEIQALNDTNQRKELQDHNVNHGYRCLDDGLQSLYSDEYNFDASFLYKIGSECSNNSSCTYNIVHKGPKLIQQGEPALGQLKLQNPVADGLKIKDIEVKLEFLNYVNTKNLIVWLDVDICSAESIKKRCFIKNPNRFTNTADDGKAYAQGGWCSPPGDVKIKFNDINSKLGEYLASLNIMNIPPEELIRTPPTTSPADQDSAEPTSFINKLRLYLLNKEHVQNNTYNTSILFSDHAPKNSKPFDFTVSPSAVIDSQIFQKDTLELQPTTAVSGYTEYENIIYNNIIKQNQLNLHNCSFRKFQDLALFESSAIGYSNTTFTLNIAVLDESDDMRVYDNIKNNDILSGLKNTEQKLQSNNIYSSLCNWQLILHISDEGKEFNEKDNLGMIRYGENPQFLGYNFICNFKDLLNDKKHLIPTVNLNAPYTFINQNLCRYQDFELMKNPTFNPIEFPYWALLFIVLNTGVVGGGTGTLVGVLSSIGDPSPGYRAIYDYFKQLRRQEILDSIRFAYDIPIYENYGDPSKVLLNVSKDGLIWYKLEASIFRYDNTPALKRNTYSFIKMKKNLCPPLSEFKFSVLGSKEFLIDKNLLNIKDVNINVDITLDDITSIDNQNVYDDDILNLTSQDETEENGLYIVYNKKLYNLYNNIRLSKKILQYSTVCNDNLCTDIQNKIDSKKILVIKSRIPFDMLDKNDSILLFNKSGFEQLASNATEITRTIVNKSLIIKDNIYYSILEISESLPSENVPNTLSFNSNNIIALFKSQTSSDMPINRWSLEEGNKLNKSVPAYELSTYGVGSYGNGSDDLYKYLLTNNYQENNLFNIKELFNNKNNDAIKINKFIITPSGSNPIETSASDIRGYDYNLNEIETQFFEYNSSTQDNSIEENIKNLMTNIKNTQSSIMYIKSNAFIGPSPAPDLYNTGTVQIGNDYYKHNILPFVSQSLIDSLVNRINFLDSDAQSSLASSLGNKQNTQNILRNGNIQDITKHYEALTDDPIECNLAPSSASNTSISNISCDKKITKQFLQNRYIERNHLIEFLEKYATKNNLGKYIEIPENKYILSNSSIKITTYDADISQPGFLGNRTVSYLSSESSETNFNISNKKIINLDIDNSVNDYYWINIDPKQSCSIAEDATVKVLKKVVYRCFTSIGTTIVMDADQVCPPIGITKDVSQDNPDENFLSTGGSYEYSIPENIIEQTKRDYPAITGWRPYIVEKQFLLNANGYRDVVVQSTETYDIADKSILGTNEFIEDFSNIKNRVYSIFNLDNVSDLKVRFRNIPRKLKTVDPFYDKYLPNKDGVPVDSINPSPGGRVFNSPAFWRCLDTKTSRYTEPTDYLKVQNEMIYRAFFGSIDGMEHKTNKLESLYPFEWIPYEYCTDCDE